MADERIEDITGGELTDPTVDDKLVILDKSDTTDDADGTVKYVELASLGFLDQTSGSDADTTMAVGNLYVVDMSSWATATRTYRLPTTAAVGDRIGIYISSGNASHELAIRTVSASTDTIDGQDVDDADFTKLFITGEIMVFECITANSAWATIYDGRIPCSCRMTLSTDDTVTSAVLTQVAFDQVAAGDPNVGSLADTTGNHSAIRRNGKYMVSFRARPALALSLDTSGNNSAIRNSGATVAVSFFRTLASSTNNYSPSIRDLFEFSDGDEIEGWVDFTFASTATIDSDNTQTAISLSEIL